MLKKKTSRSSFCDVQEMTRREPAATSDLVHVLPQESSVSRIFVCRVGTLPLMECLSHAAQVCLLDPRFTRRKLQQHRIADSIFLFYLKLLDRLDSVLLFWKK